LLSAFAPSAWAGEKPLTGPVPDWVVPAAAPVAANLPTSGSVIPLFDEQVLIDKDTVTAYLDIATLVTSPEVLNKVGTITFPWQPDHGDITFHRIEILRGNERIDALHQGAGITVLHRETGLERKIIDGQLTAVQHVEGLQVGDILRVTLSVSQQDDVLKGNIQDALELLPAPTQIGFGRVRLVWPRDRSITWKVLMPGVTPLVQDTADNRRELVVSLPVAKLPEMPKNYPTRLKPQPMILFTSFRDWSEVKAVMAPLYRVQDTIPSGSDLAGRVEAIAARSADPLRRTADALQLVQDDVRYQAVTLGSGNYVPQPPTVTWDRRYGDCKAKTLLLLAILDRLGVKAEPVLANPDFGDAVQNLPPAAIAFNHVFVRAEIDGASYWLDGTMIGSRLADLNDVPRYGTVLPLFTTGTGLVDLPRRAHARTDFDVSLVYDMSSGPYLPAPYQLELKYGGPFGADHRIEGGGDLEERLKTFAEKAAKDWTGSDDIGKPRASFDAASAVWTVRLEGVSYPSWAFEDGKNQMDWSPTLTVSLDAARDRAAWRPLPALIAQPWTAHSHVVIKLPDRGRGVAVTGGGEVALALPAVDWRRTLTLTDGDVVEDITSRETSVEIPAEAISATHKAISDAMGKTAHITLPADYPQRWIDAPRARFDPATQRIKAIYDERIAAKPDDVSRVADRAWLETRLLDFRAAEAYYSNAIALDGSSKRYLARADLRSKMGDHAGALRDAQAAYELEQGNVNARARLAAELTYAGQTDQALDLMTSDPDVATDTGLADFFDRLEVYELGARYDDAADMVNAALKKHPRMSKLLNARCWLNGLRNTDLDAALKDCNRAIELSADPASYLDSRAMIHFRAGRWQAALDDYNAALEIDPEFSNSLFMSSIVLGRLGDRDQAAERLRAARLLYPNSDQYYVRFGIKP
jgi:tetratricopeptide (TPR) repeat protein